MFLDVTMHLWPLVLSDQVHYVLERCFLCLAMAEQKKMFSLVKAVAGNKRSSEAQQTSVKKIPRVSELTPMEARPSKIVSNGPVVVCVYQAMSRGIYLGLCSSACLAYAPANMVLGNATSGDRVGG